MAKDDWTVRNNNENSCFHKIQILSIDFKSHDTRLTKNDLVNNFIFLYFSNFTADCNLFFIYGKKMTHHIISTRTELIIPFGIEYIELYVELDGETSTD